MRMHKVVSSNVNRIGYRDNDLYVQFNSGSLYKYYNVPKDVFDGMLKSESKGKFLNKEVKGTYKYKLISDFEISD